MAGFLRQNRNDEAGGSSFPKGPKFTKKPPNRKPKHAKTPAQSVPKQIKASSEGGPGSGRHGTVNDAIDKHNASVRKKMAAVPKTTAKVFAAPKHESSKVKIKTTLRETKGGSSDSGAGKYRVVLIQEGLGNLRDCFYYTKECLENSVAAFEGIKCFADHPNQIEEQIHPERSTRDILGHYEDVEYVENDGRGALEGTLILCEGEHFDWAKSLLTNALEYATKYKNAEFVGFSINAQGEATSQDLDEFMGSNDLNDDIIGKLQKAQSEGIDEIRPVSVLRDAVSVDLVTEAGAGGKILSMMERNKEPMKNKTKAQKEADLKRKKLEAKKAKAKEAAEAREENSSGEMDAGGEDPGQKDHADADQDTALFQKMISQYLGDDHGNDDEECMKMAKHAHEHFMKQGMEAEEAYEAAGTHLKNAAAIGKNMGGSAEESEEHEEGEEHEESEEHEEGEESEEHEESGDGDGETPPPSPKNKGAKPMAQESKKEMINLKAEVASLRESQRKMQVSSYLEKKIAGLDRSPEFIKAFKEALGKPRSTSHIDEILSVFEKAADAASADSASGEDYSFSENNSNRLRESGGAKVIDFADCVK